MGVRGLVRGLLVALLLIGAIVAGGAVALVVSPDATTSLPVGLAVAAVTLLAVAAAVLLVLDARVVRPVRRISADVVMVAGTGDTQRRLAPERLAELDDLVAGVNALQEAYQRQAKALQDATALLEDVSSRDALTQLVNQRTAAETVEREMRRSRRNGLPVSLVLIDIDHLHRLNDEEGFAAGDRALRVVGRALSAGLRGTDLVARWNGDGVLAVLVDTDRSGAEHVAHDMRERVQRAQATSAKPVTVSIGVATYDGQSTISPKEFCSRAEEAAHRAKLAGGDRVEVER